MSGRRVFLFDFALFVLFSVGSTQDIRISGTVTGLEGTPIAGAQIALETGGLTATSNAQGEFTLTDGDIGVGAPNLPGIAATVRNGFLNLRLDQKSRVTLAVFSTLGEKLSSQNLALEAGDQALSLYGKPGLFLYKVTVDGEAFAFKHYTATRTATRTSRKSSKNREVQEGENPSALAKPAAPPQPFYDVLTVTAGGYLDYEANLMSGSDGMDTSGLEIVLLQEDELDPFSFFVTSLVAMRELSGSEDGFGGDLRYGETGPGAGLRGADKICTEVAEGSMPGASAKQWRAFLSVTDGGNGEPVDAVDRIGEGPWYDRLGRVVSENLNGLLAADRPEADPAIAEDLPNEIGEPNHTAGGVEMDNHDVLTGSDSTGRLHENRNCEDWTSIENPDDGDGGPFGNGPMAGHSWPARSGQNWINAHGVAGCAPSVVVGQGSFSGDGVGDGGGYGGIYCFALIP